MRNTARLCREVVYLNRAEIWFAGAAIINRVLKTKRISVLAISHDPIDCYVPAPGYPSTTDACLDSYCHRVDSAVCRGWVLPCEAKGGVSAKKAWKLIGDDPVLLAEGLSLVDQLIRVDYISRRWACCRVDRRPLRLMIAVFVLTCRCVTKTYSLSKLSMQRELDGRMGHTLLPSIWCQGWGQAWTEERLEIRFRPSGRCLHWRNSRWL